MSRESSRGEEKYRKYGVLERYWDKILLRCYSRFREGEREMMCSDIRKKRVNQKEDWRKMLYTYETEKPQKTYHFSTQNSSYIRKGWGKYRVRECYESRGMIQRIKMRKSQNHISQYREVKVVLWESLLGKISQKLTENRVFPYFTFHFFLPHRRKRVGKNKKGKIFQVSEKYPQKNDTLKNGKEE